MSVYRPRASIYSLSTNFANHRVICDSLQKWLWEQPAKYRKLGMLCVDGPLEEFDLRDTGAATIVKTHSLGVLALCLGPSSTYRDVAGNLHWAWADCFRPDQKSPPYPELAAITKLFVAGIEAQLVRRVIVVGGISDTRPEKDEPASWIGVPKTREERWAMKSIEDDDLLEIILYLHHEIVAVRGEMEIVSVLQCLNAMNLFTFPSEQFTESFKRAFESPEPRRPNMEIVRKWLPWTREKDEKA